MSTTQQTLSDVIINVTEVAVGNVINATEATAGNVTINATVANVITTTTAADVIGNTTTSDVISGTTEADVTEFWWDQARYGIHGNSEVCSQWYSNVPGSFYQAFSLVLHLAFLAGGSSANACLYHYSFVAVSFVFLGVWAGLQGCLADVVVWAAVLTASNVGQVIYTSIKSKKTEQAFEGDQNKVYNNFFAPFDVSKTTFAELVGVKGFHKLSLKKDHSYAIAGKTTVDRLALVVSGKLKVQQGGKVLHTIQKNEFVDSPEWDALKDNNKGTATFNVTITAENNCRCIVWKRKPLLALLAKDKQLNKLFNCYISLDIMKKLNSLNSKRFTDRGFHYDVRLPCVISLRQDVEERERRALAQQTPNLAGQRSRKLGRKAAQDYARILEQKHAMEGQLGGAQDSQGFLTAETKFVNEQ